MPRSKEGWLSAPDVKTCLLGSYNFSKYALILFPSSIIFLFKLDKKFRGISKDEARHGENLSIEQTATIKRPLVFISNHHSRCVIAQK